MAASFEQSDEPTVDESVQKDDHPSDSKPCQADEEAPKESKRRFVVHGESEHAEVVEFLAEPLTELRDALDMPVWVVIQCGPCQGIGQRLYRDFFQQRERLGGTKRVALVLHTPGGSADDAYRIVRLIQRRVDELFTVVPIWAKSAGTLMALAGKKLYMGRDAELGPLDVQIRDYDREKVGSALDEVQALDRLRAFTLATMDEAMMMLLGRTGKKIDTVLPHALEFATAMVRPLFEGLDSIEYTRKARDLAIAEDYAELIMQKNYPPDESRRIASVLVKTYPTHGFVVDYDEAKRVGLRLAEDGLELDRLAGALHIIQNAGITYELCGAFEEESTFGD